MQLVNYWVFKEHIFPGTQNQGQKFEAISLKSPSDLSDDEKMKGTSPGGKSVQRVQPSAAALPSLSLIKHYDSSGWRQVNLDLNFLSPFMVALSAFCFFDSGDAELPKENKIKCHLFYLIFNCCLDSSKKRP